MTTASFNHDTTYQSRQRHKTIQKTFVYIFLIVWAAIFLLPLYVMVVTAFKSMDEIRNGSLTALPSTFDVSSWRIAWSEACAGLECSGLRVGFINSLIVLIPSVVGTVILGLITGYAVALWRIRLSKFTYAVLIFGSILPTQVYIYPLVVFYSSIGLQGSLLSIYLTHIFFNLPITALLFRNYFLGLPIEIVKAARVDGAGFFTMLWYVLAPMSAPVIAVSAILDATLIWNNFLVGIVFGGRDYFPMTVQLNNIVNSTFGEKAYNVNMAATILTSAVPLLIYFISGRWFVRGIAAGAVKG